MPMRAAFYSICRFVEKLDENGLTFDFHSYYSAAQVRGLIRRYNTVEYRDELEKKNNHLREAFQNEYTSNYEAYRQYVYFVETKELIEQFGAGARFAVLGSIDKYQHLELTFRKLGIPLQTPNLEYEESYDATKDLANVFIVMDKEKIDTVSKYVSSVGGDNRRLLDIGRYYFSFAPARVFVENNIDSD
jgi:hypothetical protein